MLACSFARVWKAWLSCTLVLTFLIAYAASSLTSILVDKCLQSLTNKLHSIFKTIRLQRWLLFAPSSSDHELFDELGSLVDI